MFDKILYFFVNLLPPKLRALFDKFEELIVYVYYGVLTTIVNTIVQFGMEFGILSHVDWSERVENFTATSVAWVVAVIFAFYVNKKYVFKRKTESMKQLVWEMWTFVSARVLSWAMSVGIMQLGVPLYMNDDDTKNFWIYALFYFVQQVVVTLANYFLSKFIIFKKKKTEDA